jgi:hypothetical protein
MKQVARGVEAARWLDENDLNAGWQALTAAIDRALELAKARPVQPTQTAHAVVPLVPAHEQHQSAARTVPPSTPVHDRHPDSEPAIPAKRGLLRRMLDGRR